MSDQDEQSSSDIDSNYTNGHNITWEGLLNNLTALKLHPFSDTFETYCETSHSEWKFDMSLPEVREDGTCSLHVRLLRTDDNHTYLAASVKVSFYNLEDELIFDEEWFDEVDMVPGDLIEETVELTPLPNMRDAVHQNAKLSVYLAVSYCHSDIESN